MANPAEYNRLRTQIAKKYCGGGRKIGMILTDRILAIDGIEIRADDQSPPNVNNVTMNLLGEPCSKSCHQAEQHRMLKAGFVKVIPKPK